MADPIFGSNSRQETPGADRLHEKAREFSSEAEAELERLAGGARRAASEIYNRFDEWLDQGNRRTIGVFSLIVAVGAVGFLLGRARDEKSGALKLFRR